MRTEQLEVTLDFQGVHPKQIKVKVTGNNAVRLGDSNQELLQTLE